MPADSSRCTRPIPVALLTIAISACSGPPHDGTATRHPAPAPAPPGTSDNFAGVTLPSGPSASNPASPSPDSSDGPPPASTREVRGYFTSTSTRNSLRLWKGPNDRQGYERLTRFTVEVDGVPEYSRAVSVIRLVGVCRSSGKGLDQLLLSFHPERRGGAALGVLRHDADKGRFVLGFAPKDARLDCAGGRVLFPEGAPSLPCTCPWRDGPDDRSGAAAAADARDILIFPEESGGPAFTRPEAGNEFLPEEATDGADRR